MARRERRLCLPRRSALPKQVQTLDNALRAFAQTLLRYTGSDIRSLVGAGAAGGLAGGLCAMLGAHLAGGVETLLCEAGFDALALRSSLVVTGEGRIDEQSMQGKVPWGVAKHAPHTPVIAIAGGVQGDRSTLACQMGLVRIYEANYRQRPPHEIGRYCERIWNILPFVPQRNFYRTAKQALIEWLKRSYVRILPCAGVFFLKRARRYAILAASRSIPLRAGRGRAISGDGECLFDQSKVERARGGI